MNEEQPNNMKQLQDMQHDDTSSNLPPLLKEGVHFMVDIPDRIYLDSGKRI